VSSDISGSVTQAVLLGGRVTSFQPAKGYRTAIDAVILAAAVPAREGERVLDIGTGVGVTAFCLAARVPGADVTGLELQPPLAALAARGVIANDYQERVEIITADLLDPPPSLEPQSFDHVMANPPYAPAGSGNPPPDPIKAMAMVEGEAKLIDWLRFGAAMVKPGGSMTMIHRAERQDEVTSGMEAEGFGALDVLPIAPKPGGIAKRVIVRGWKGREGESIIHPSLILHLENDPSSNHLGHRPAYTPAAQAVLRDGESLL
jgi:tRNA1(Val) A37 N6-methylase TrmN6